MAPPLGREVSASLRFLAIPFCPDGSTPVPCLGCAKPLDIHQPDARLPDRMLATCDGCKSWHLIDCDPDGGVVVVLLPDPAALLAALRKP